MTVVVRTEHGAAEIRALAKAAVTPEQARRLLAMALVLEGTSRAEAARSMGPRARWRARCSADGASALPNAGSANPAVDRGAIDGCTVSTPPGRWVWSTARRRAGNGGWARGNSRNWLVAWRAAPSWLRTGWSAGVWPISAPCQLC